MINSILSFGDVVITSIWIVLMFIIGHYIYNKIDTGQENSYFIFISTHLITGVILLVIMGIIGGMLSWKVLVQTIINL